MEEVPENVGELISEICSAECASEMLTAFERDPIMISALEHYSYCPRQCALIHIEQVFTDNVYTIRGKYVHTRVHETDSFSRDGKPVEFSLPLWSARLGLIGRADVVEFHGNIPYPVDYKSGRSRGFQHEVLQLCGQALCLEEMLGVEVPAGAIYYYGSRRRREVYFTDEMRLRVATTADAIRKMLASGRLPPPVSDGRCHNCSLIERCMPRVVTDKGKVRTLARELFRA